MDSISKISRVILFGFIAFYSSALAVNLVKALSGMEELAIHQWPFLIGLAYIGRLTMPAGLLAKMGAVAVKVLQASGRIIKKAAKVSLFILRAACCLPALIFDSRRKLQSTK